MRTGVDRHWACHFAIGATKASGWARGRSRFVLTAGTVADTQVSVSRPLAAHSGLTASAPRTSRRCIGRAGRHGRVAPVWHISLASGNVHWRGWVGFPTSCARAGCARKRTALCALPRPVGEAAAFDSCSSGVTGLWAPAFHWELRLAASYGMSLTTLRGGGDSGATRCSRQDDAMLKAGHFGGNYGELFLAEGASVDGLFVLGWASLPYG